MIPIFRRRLHSDGRVLFVFFGLAVTLVLIGLLLQYSHRPRRQVSEAPSITEVDPSSVLPSGVLMPTYVSLEPSIEPAYGFAYRIDETFGVATVEWVPREGSYRLRDTLMLHDVSMNGVPSIRVASASWRGEPVFVVSGVREQAIGMSAIIVSENGRLQLLRIRDMEGAIRPALFAEGNNGTEYASISFEDVDGDGIVDVRVRRGDIESGVWTNSTVAVYRFVGGLLEYDAKLSNVYTMSMDVFPTIPNPIDEGIDAETAGL